MTEKSKILLFFITLIFAGTVLLLVAMLTTGSGSEEKTDTPDSFPVDNNGGNVIDLGSEDDDKYTYVGITEDDTIRIYKEDGTSLGVNLERNGWQDLKVSEDPNVISVLGERTTANKDLGLYFQDSGKFDWYTNYGDQPTGILQYGWLDDKTVYFHQGISGDEWFHTFEYPSQTQIKKIFKSNGQILNLNSDKSDILYSFRGEYQTFDTQGEMLWEMKNIVDQNLKTVNSIENPLFTKDLDKIVFTSQLASGVGIYKINAGETESVKLSTEFTNFQPVCAVSEDDIIGVRVDDQGDSEIIFLDVREEVIELTVNVSDSSEEVVLSSFDCLSLDHLLFKTFTEDGSSIWYEYLDGELKILSFLADHKEIKFINSSLED